MNAARRLRPRRLDSQRGQILPLVALLALVLFGFAALALDGGLAFSDRRIDQNLADSAALAGAHELHGSVTATEVSNAFTQARGYLVDGLNKLGTAGTCGAFGGPGLVNLAGSNTFTCTVGSYTATMYWPPVSVTSGDTRHMLEVQLLHHNTPSLMAAAGLGNVLNIGSHAVALNGKAVPPHSHAVWSTYDCGGCNGGGNTLDIDGSGAAQVDDGNNGTDCNSTTGADMFSDEKIHAPGQDLNVNGLIHRTKKDQDSKLQEWWNGGGSASTAARESAPAYEPPPVNSVSTTPPLVYNAVYGADNPAPVSTGTSPAATLTFAPGHYTRGVTVGSGGVVTYGTTSYTGVSDVVFRNGVYLFDNASLEFNAGGGLPEAHSWDYHLVAGKWTATFPGTSDPGDATDLDTTTDGVEFYMHGTGTFSALGGMVNLQAPSTIDRTISGAASAGVTNFITVFVDSADSGDVPSAGRFGQWPGTVKHTVLAIGVDNGTYGGAPSNYFHEQGVVYVGWDGTTPQSIGAMVAPSSLDMTEYAVQGQFAAPYVGITQGSVPGATGYSSCHDDTTTPTAGAGKVVQYDSRFVPNTTFGVGAQLYQ